MSEAMTIKAYSSPTGITVLGVLDACDAVKIVVSLADDG